MTTGATRNLTDGEKTILGLVQRFYGKHNTREQVFFVPASTAESSNMDAFIFPTDANGSKPILINLSYFVHFYLNEGVALSEIKKQLVPPVKS